MMAADNDALIKQDHYAAKPADYFSHPRWDYVNALPVDPKAAILEIGCGDGATGAMALADGKCGRYVGVELFESMALRARDRLSEVLIGNVEAIDLPLEPATFDALIASEVLEHLIDPGAVLARLRPLLRPGARVMASSPCVAYWRNILNLVRGRFDYTDSGMMDRTHLRWFTPDSYARMFREAGFVVDRVGPTGDPSLKNRIARRLLGRRFSSMLFFRIDLYGHVPAA